MSSETIITEELAAEPPSWFWTAAEGRAVFELGSFFALRPFLSRLPRGDGHPVMLLPGFLASERSMAPMQKLLRDLRYRAYDWGLGRNMRFDDEREQELLDQLDRIFFYHREKISLIGWSLGGLFAREIAKARPDRVRCVISLGSPIKKSRHVSNARHVYDRVNGTPDQRQLDRVEQINTPPPVPTTSIYSKTDGIVAWQGSIQDPCPNNPNTENIEVPASHIGIGVNPIAMYAIADRLAQPEGEWSPFDRGGVRRLFFGAP